MSEVFGSSTRGFDLVFLQPPAWHLEWFDSAPLVLTLLYFLPIAWCFRMLGGPHSRLVRNFQAGLIALAALYILFSFALFQVRLVGQVTTTFDVIFSLGGVARILVLATVGYAIFYGDLLARPLTPPTVRRGTLAGVGLMSLFITAQVAQNFLSDEFGLLMGGVVAGVVVFAAFPLQHLAERHVRASHNDDVFRRAVKSALRDRVLKPKEERELMVLAGRLCLRNERAYAILDEERPEAQAWRLIVRREWSCAPPPCTSRCWMCIPRHLRAALPRPPSVWRRPAAPHRFSEE